MDNKLLTPMEVAEMLSIGRTKIYELLASGVIPSIRIGRSVRVSTRVLEAWITNISETQSRENPDPNSNH